MVDTSTNSWKLLYESGRQALQARKLQDAEQSFSAALQLAEDFAPADPRLAATLNALARIYSLQRRYLAAAALLNRLLEVTERTLGNNHVQVAGVLTNLAEMYTHLGAAREELELRERVLAIRGDDPNADTNALQRLGERVIELRATLAAQESPADDDEIEMEALPIVRTDEYSSPAPTPIRASVAAVESSVIELPAETTPVAPIALVERDDAYRLSPAGAQLSVAPWPGAAATGNTPTSGHTVAIIPAVPIDARQSFSPSKIDKYPVESPVLPLSLAADHGFSDMGRDELRVPIMRHVRRRTSVYSIAAGVVLVAGILAARTYVAGDPDDERVSAGSVSVSLANATVAPVMQPVAAIAVAPEPPRTVDRIIAERSAKRASDESSRGANEKRSVIVDRAPKLPSAADLERTLKSVDVAVKALDQRTRAATDSATTIQLQAPTFKKVKLADQP